MGCGIDGDGRGGLSAWWTCLVRILFPSCGLTLKGGTTWMEDTLRTMKICTLTPARVCKYEGTGSVPDG